MRLLNANACCNPPTLWVIRRVDDSWSQNLSPPSSHPTTQSQFSGERFTSPLPLSTGSSHRLLSFARITRAPEIWCSHLGPQSKLGWIGTLFRPYAEPLIFVPRRFSLEVSSKKNVKMLIFKSIYKTPAQNDTFPVTAMQIHVWKPNSRRRSLLSKWQRRIWIYAQRCLVILACLNLCMIFNGIDEIAEGFYFRSGLPEMVKNHVHIEYASQGAKTVFTKHLYL